MADREKLIECLKYCASTSTTQNNCNGCKRWDFDFGSYRCVDDLMMQAAATLEQQKWIPVTERLPEYGQEVAVCVHFPFDEDARMAIAPYTPAMQTTFWERVTHWMPMPEPPKGE